MLTTYNNSFQASLQQMFVRDCTDPLILDHVPTFAHTFCDHVCGFPMGTGSASDCNPQGYCICKPPCSDVRFYICS